MPGKSRPMISNGKQMRRRGGAGDKITVHELVEYIETTLTVMKIAMEHVTEDMKNIPSPKPLTQRVLVQEVGEQGEILSEEQKMQVVANFVNQRHPGIEYPETWADYATMITGRSYSPVILEALNLTAEMGGSEPGRLVAAFNIYLNSAPEDQLVIRQNLERIYNQVEDVTYKTLTHFQKIKYQIKSRKWLTTLINICVTMLTMLPVMFMVDFTMMGFAQTEALIGDGAQSTYNMSAEHVASRFMAYFGMKLMFVLTRDLINMTNISPRKKSLATSASAISIAALGAYNIYKPMTTLLDLTGMFFGYNRVENGIIIRTEELGLMDKLNNLFPFAQKVEPAQIIERAYTIQPGFITGLRESLVFSVYQFIGKVAVYFGMSQTQGFVVNLVGSLLIKEMGLVKYLLLGTANGVSALGVKTNKNIQYPLGISFEQFRTIRYGLQELLDTMASQVDTPTLSPSEQARQLMYQQPSLQGEYVQPQPIEYVSNEEPVQPPQPQPEAPVLRRSTRRSPRLAQ